MQQLEVSPEDLAAITHLTPEEQQVMEEAAYYEQLMEAHGLNLEELAAGQDFRQDDEAIMQRALGAFDEASKHYSKDTAKLLAVVDAMGAQLEMAGCNHEHFKEQVNERLAGNRDQHGHEFGADEHDHTKGGKKKKNKSKEEQKKAQKLAGLFGYLALIRRSNLRRAA
jgi:hypothetical protein